METKAAGWRGYIQVSNKHIQGIIPLLSVGCGVGLSVSQMWTGRGYEALMMVLRCCSRPDGLRSSLSYGVPDMLPATRRGEMCPGVQNLPA